MDYMNNSLQRKEDPDKDSDKDNRRKFQEDGMAEAEARKRESPGKRDCRGHKEQTSAHHWLKKGSGNHQWLARKTNKNHQSWSFGKWLKFYEELIGGKRNWRERDNQEAAKVIHGKSYRALTRQL